MKIFTLGLFVILFAELSLRLIGLHTLPVYDRSDNYEYCTKPNQRCEILGKTLTSNSVGLRGELPSQSAKSIVWYCGDSVIHGGVHTDDDSLATFIWDKRVESKLQHSIATVNISQGSWGPDNTFAFVQEHASKLGNPDLLVLALSSHDWDDTMTFCYSGHTRDMPGKIYTALYGLWNKYFGPTSLCIPEGTANSQNPGLNKWLLWSKSKNIPMVVYFHPTRNELLRQTRDTRGALLKEWLTTNDVDFIDGMEFLNVSDYRDNIHPNEKGQKRMAKALQKIQIHIR